MKTRVLLALTLLVGLAASAQAATPTIVGTKHDLSSTNNTGSTLHSATQNQTCVFCHAPHNATTNKLLWNRAAVAGASMSIYTSYNTGDMRTALTQNTLSDNSTSLLCLSCHSLTVANDIALNTSNSKGGATLTSTVANTTFPSVTGGMNSLTNDHPVGIDYDAAQSVATATGLVASAGGKVNGLRLFNSSVSATSSMECASCHNVHDNTQGKFLAVSNSGSGLCVKCHVK